MIIDFQERLVSQECIECSITFAITATMEAQLRKSLRTFQCPNGHAMNYKGILEKEKLEKRIAELEAVIAERGRSLTDRWNENQRLTRRIASLTGVITRMKKGRAK